MDSEDNAFNTFNNHGGRYGVQARNFNNNGSMTLNITGFNHAEDEKKKCLGTLLFDTYNARKQDISEASSKTCDWLLETPEFKQWRDRSNLSKHNGVFWLKGKPGSGKSTMMRHISHRLQPSDDAVLVEHFFNARGSGLEKTYLGLLRSLIYQLLVKVPLLYNAFVSIYHEKDMNQGQWEWRQSELRNFLRSELKCSKMKLIILVDALDECDLDEIALVVSFLESLSLDAVEAGTHLRICLSSRPYPNVSMRKNLEFTLDGHAEHDKDIKKYVWAKLKTDNPEIEERILRKADGVFLWVVLVVEILNKAVDRGHPEEIQKALDNIPSDVDIFFERVIFSDPEKSPETLLMFQLVLFSQEQLTLEELVFAVIAKFHKGHLKPRSQSKMTSGLLRARIIDSSKGLIEVSDSTLRVQFIHQTVTDFFLRNRRLERLYSTPEPDAIAASHDELRACCLNYIEKCPIGSQSHNGQSTEKLRNEYPFLHYSAMHLLDHAEAALQGHQLGIENDRWPLSSDPWYQTWKRIMFAIGETEYLHEDLNVGLVYILILHNFHNLLGVVLKRSDVDINTQGGSFNNALQLAVTKRDDVATKMLLELDANVHLNGGYFGTVLQVASSLGNYSLVSTIIEKGADLNASGGLYGTALQAAAARGNLRVLDTLLERGAKVDVYGGIYGSALQGAVHNGNLEGVNLLLKQGALVNSDGGIYGSVLHAAIEGYRFKIFRLLLRAGADVNSCGGIYGSWLNPGEIFDHPGSMAWVFRSRSLALMGTTTTTFNLENGPALVWAARNLEYDEVRLLLENGANVNAASGPWKSKVPVMCNIQQLRGVSFNHESDSSGQTAIHKAAANGHVDVMCLLLDHADIYDTHDWSDTHVIRYTEIETMIVNGGFSSVWSDDHENDIIGKVEMNGGFLSLYEKTRGDRSIQCLIMNGGFLYAVPKTDTFRIDIEKIQINGGICYFDIMNTSDLRIQTLEMNGGSFHLMIHGRNILWHHIDNIRLNNGHLFIDAMQVTLNKVLLSGGSFNCKSFSDFDAHQIALGSTLSGSFRRQSIADSLSITGLPEICVKHSDGHMEQHGAAQPGDQSMPMSSVLSPLYVAARNGHLEAAKLLLESGAKFTNAWTPINPLYIAQRHGHNEIVRFLQEEGQEIQEKKERQEEDDDDDKKGREIDERVKEIRSTREIGGRKQGSKRRWRNRRERNEGDCRML